MNPLAPYMAAIKVGALVAVVVALGLFGWRVHAWHEGFKQAASVKAEAAREVAQARQAVADMNAQYTATQKASEGYQHELETIRARPVDRSPVRLCRAAPASVPLAAAPAGGLGAAVSASGVLSGTDGSDPAMREGPDIGPALRELARFAEEVSAQGRAIQSLPR